eukprot:Clim_evm83s109 gene=Clim_evmTU83s109
MGRSFNMFTALAVSVVVAIAALSAVSGSESLRYFTASVIGMVLIYVKTIQEWYAIDLSDYKNIYPTDKKLKPVSARGDGDFFVNWFERFLRPVHGALIKRMDLKETDNVLDACCGAGGCSLRVISKVKSVTGVDLSPRSIEAAKKRIAGSEETTTKGNETALKFICQDAAFLSEFKDGHFDVSYTSMGMHTMPPSTRVKFLRELCRVTKRSIYVIDFTKDVTPLSLAGLQACFLEFLGGPQHFAGFLSFRDLGGVENLGTIVEDETDWKLKKVYSTKVQVVSVAELCKA